MFVPPLLKMGGKEPMMMAALFFALAIGLWGLFEGIKPFKNHWILLFMLFMLFSAWQAPRPMIPVWRSDLAKFWVWKAMLLHFVFLLMFLSIRSSDFSEKEKNHILKVMVWVGLIVSLHCIGHALGLHQWMRQVANRGRESIRQADVGSFIGHPTMISPFIAMIIPFALKLKKYVFAGIMAIGVAVTCSMVAIGAMVMSLLFLLSKINKKCAISAAIILVVLTSTVIILAVNNDKVAYFISDSGRFELWAKIYNNFKAPYITQRSYSYTGFGPGGFTHIYPHKFNRYLKEAHNEYLETMFNTGVIGLALLVTGIIVFLRRNRRSCHYLYSSLICVLLSAG
ncbi:hypothetical protein LCGC14_2837720, partial [marine sediment metagenome]